MFYFDLPLKKIAFEKRERKLSELTARWQEVEDYWAQQTKINPRLHNDFHFACNGIHVRQGSLVVFSNLIEYKLDQFATAFNCHIPGSNTIGIGVFGYDEETENYYLTERSSSVSHYANKIHLVGGTFDYTERAYGDFYTAIHSAIRNEIEEEVELQEPYQDSKLEYMFVMYDEATTALSFRFKYNGAFRGVTNHENTALVVIPRSELLNFIKNNHNRISISTFRTLMWEHGTRIAKELASFTAQTN